MTSWASPTAWNWRSSACTIAFSNHLPRHRSLLSPHPETAALPASPLLLKIQRLFRKFSATGNQYTAISGILWALNPNGPNAGRLKAVPGCGLRVSSIKSERLLKSRRDGRVAEGARLESVYTGNRIGGSNPSLSAITFGNAAMPVALSSEIKGLIDAPNFAHFATLMPDGSPQSVPVWIGRED